MLTQAGKKKKKHHKVKHTEYATEPLHTLSPIHEDDNSMRSASYGAQYNATNPASYNQSYNQSYSNQAYSPSTPTYKAPAVPSEVAVNKNMNSEVNSGMSTQSQLELAQSVNMEPNFVKKSANTSNANVANTANFRSAHVKMDDDFDEEDLSGPPSGY